jgi:hypothetical protein
VDAVTVEAESALVGESVRRKPPLRIGPVRLRLRDVVVNPGRPAATGAAELDVGAPHVEALITERDLGEFRPAARLWPLRATMETGWIERAGRCRGPLSARLALAAGSPLIRSPHAADVRYAAWLPRLLVDWIVRNFTRPRACAGCPCRCRWRRFDPAGRLEVGEDQPRRPDKGVTLMAESVVEQKARRGRS